MFRETLFFKTALYSAYDWLAKIRQLIFCRVPSALQLLSVSVWQRGEVSSLFVNGRKKPAVNPQTFRLCQSLSLSGEVARRSRDGEGCFRDEPSQSRCARQLSRGESPWQRGQVSSSPVNGRKKPAVKLQTFRLCQSLSLSGEVARRSRDGEGCFQDEPSQSPTATALPRGEPLAKRGSFVLIRQRQEEVCR